jgi:hypothetical protein
MPLRAPISHHLDLYRYWLAKRGGSAMPARRDINPGDIPTLLPYLTIVDRFDGQFRYRLFGTRVAELVGRDLTGRFVGSYVGSAPESAAGAQAIYKCAFERAHPIFATGKFKIKSGATHNMAQLTLPLSDDGANVNMAVSIFAARFNFDVKPSADWLKGLLLKKRDVAVVHNAIELDTRCREWEWHCNDQRLRAEDIVQRA